MKSYYELIDLGVFVLDGTDEYGEPMVSLDVEKARIFAPEIYHIHSNAIDEAILEALELGLLDWDFDPETLEVTYIVKED